MSGLAWTPASVEVIVEDEGLYERETWPIQRYYDDPDDPMDEPGIIMEGQDPADPSGPAVDFEQPPGSLSLEEERCADEEECDREAEEAR